MNGVREVDGDGIEWIRVEMDAHKKRRRFGRCGSVAVCALDNMTMFRSFTCVSLVCPWCVPGVSLVCP